MWRCRAFKSFNTCTCCTRRKSALTSQEQQTARVYFQQELVNRSNCPDEMWRCRAFKSFNTCTCCTRRKSALTSQEQQTARVYFQQELVNRSNCPDEMWRCRALSPSILAHPVPEWRPLWGHRNNKLQECTSNGTRWKIIKTCVF